MHDIFYINKEEVKVCPDYPNYCASREGNVYRCSTKKLMKKTKAKDGYYDCRVCHNNNPKSVKYHLLIANAWLPLIEGKNVVNHINGDKTDCRLVNLERCTEAENQRHAVSTGLKQSCEDLYNASMNNEIVHELCKLLEQGKTVRHVSDIYPTLSVDAIRKLKTGSTYFTIYTQYSIPHVFKNSIPEDYVHEVCKLCSAGISDANISKHFNNEVKIIDIKRIRYKIRYKDISDLYF